jgi:hypothetical protein
MPFCTPVSSVSHSGRKKNSRKPMASANTTEPKMVRLVPTLFFGLGSLSSSTACDAEYDSDEIPIHIISTRPMAPRTMGMLRNL